MLTENMSYVPVRSGAYPHQSYPPAMQTAMQPGSHVGEKTNAHVHTFDAAYAPYMHEPLNSTNGHLPPTLLTSQKPLSTHNADKESRAEEGLLEEEKSEAGDEGQSSDYTFWGVNLKPVGLAVSTVIGALCMLFVQIPMLARFTSLSQVWLLAGFSALYVVTLGCMTYCGCADPGQVKKTRNMKVGPKDIEEGLPLRSHKSWQYARPIRRYDHYCKWVHNVIGLLNHREFVIMVGGLVLVAVLGIIVDVWLAVVIAWKGFFESEIIMIVVVALHLGYSMALLYIDGPILKIHCGLISRNEMAKEWKEKDHYVANNTTMGDNIPVDDLDDDEYNEFFDRDAFQYDPTRNPFDNGMVMNCTNFWCQPRWADEKGEF